jgi:hypothetical protein
MDNATYVRIRNSFIPEAELFADQKAGPKPRQRLRKGARIPREDFEYHLSLDAWSRRWNTIFFKKMDDMAYENGLINRRVPNEAEQKD